MWKQDKKWGGTGVTGTDQVIKWQKRLVHYRKCIIKKPKSKNKTKILTNDHTAESINSDKPTCWWHGARCRSPIQRLRYHTSTCWRVARAKPSSSVLASHALRKRIWPLKPIRVESVLVWHLNLSMGLLHLSLSLELGFITIYILSALWSFVSVFFAFWLKCI